MTKRGLLLSILIGSVTLLSPPAGKCEEKKAQPIGKISWQIRDGWNIKVLSSGQKEIFAKDVQIKNSYIKIIDLDKDFYFRYEETGDADKLDGGFGFRCGRYSQDTFSWEWFTVDKKGHAKKLQEKGELEFDTVKTARGPEINRMKFLTDISFRILREGEWNPFFTSWRINVSKDSYIVWPHSQKDAVTQPSYSVPLQQLKQSK